tara:strand:+ start:357 stop:797 length:441 start_codon:yes stop_codon:yes gene_type:complete
MHEVGQVLYVILSKKQRVIPIQIAEQIVRRSIEGESIQYLVKVPGKNDFVDLKLFGDEIYSTLDEVQEQLMKNANKAIFKMTEQAKALVHDHFPKDLVALKEPVYHPSSIEKPNDVQVTLEDGTIANIRMDDDILALNKKKVSLAH